MATATAAATCLSIVQMQRLRGGATVAAPGSVFKSDVDVNVERRRGGRGGGTVAARAMNMGRESDRELKKGIAEFYDESSGLWESVWGDHMHHGFYDPHAQASVSGHRSAQIRMIEEALSFATISDNPLRRPKHIVDVGCGIGGCSRYLAWKYDAKCQGITLSPVQAQRAQALAVAQGLADKVSFQVADALNQPFSDGQFDLVWSMESGEHMPDKTKFVSELARVAAPGATIIIVTWCHRDLSDGEESLRPEEEQLLKMICDAYYLPAWCSTADYVKIAQSLSLEDIKRADWSDNVAPFWPAVIRSALTWKGFTSLLGSGTKHLEQFNSIRWKLHLRQLYALCYLLLVVPLAATVWVQK